MIISTRLQQMYLIFVLLFMMLAGGEAKAQKLSYVDFRISGPLINGDTRIEEDGDYTTLDVRATLVPEMATSPELIQLMYSNDASQKVFSVNLTVVPQTAPYSVQKGSPYVISIYDGANRYSMSTSLISMHITKLTLGKTYAFGSLGIKEIEANFTGKVLYRNLDKQNAEEVEHLIDGSLYYQGRI